MYLDITSKPFVCRNCTPGTCDKCTTDGCDSCTNGYFQRALSKYDKVSFYCDKCSELCLTCKNNSDDCTSCPQYYVLSSDNECVFKYLYVTVILGILVVMMIILLIYLCIYCLCKERKPTRKITRYGSILDRDPDLGMDNIVYTPQTIGLSDEVTLSEVSPDDNYLNMSTMSKEDLIRKMTNMIPGEYNMQDQMEEEFKDTEENFDWIGVSEPSVSQKSKRKTMYASNKLNKSSFNTNGESN
jgi:hypothetical protein